MVPEHLVGVEYGLVLCEDLLEQTMGYLGVVTAHPALGRHHLLVELETVLGVGVRDGVLVLDATLPWPAIYPRAWSWAIVCSSISGAASPVVASISSTELPQRRGQLTCAMRLLVVDIGSSGDQLRS